LSTSSSVRQSPLSAPTRTVPSGTENLRMISVGELPGIHELHKLLPPAVEPASSLSETIIVSVSGMIHTSSRSPATVGGAPESMLVGLVRTICVRSGDAESLLARVLVFVVGESSPCELGAASSATIVSWNLSFLCIAVEDRQVGGSGVPGQRHCFIANTGRRLPSIRSVPEAIKMFCAPFAMVHLAPSIHCDADAELLLLQPGFASFPGMMYSLSDALMNTGVIGLL
jgi:hypothetical protein